MSGKKYLEEQLPMVSSPSSFGLTIVAWHLPLNCRNRLPNELPVSALNDPTLGRERAVFEGYEWMWLEWINYYLESFGIEALRISEKDFISFICIGLHFPLKVILTF